MRKLMEPLLMFGLILGYIWRLRLIHPYSWIVIPMLMLLSHVMHHDTAESVGFERKSLRIGLKEVSPVLIAIAAMLLAAGAFRHTLRQIDLAGVLLSAAAYLPWGLAQQYMLNGYFLNRLDEAIPKPAAALMAAVLFSAVHAPNPFLMAVTLPLGLCAILFYRRNHNLYVLGIAHAVIGLLLFLVIPDSVSRHLRIGPGWYDYPATRRNFIPTAYGTAERSRTES
jgi:membrane protease YdiL (CAAX protease family)